MRFSSGKTFQDIAAARTDVLDAQSSHLLYGIQTKEIDCLEAAVTDRAEYRIPRPRPGELSNIVSVSKNTSCAQ